MSYLDQIYSVLNVYEKKVTRDMISNFHDCNYGEMILLCLQNVVHNLMEVNIWFLNDLLLSFKCPVEKPQ